MKKQIVQTLATAAAAWAVIVAPASAAQYTVDIDAAQLPVLTNGATYETWLVTGEQKVSLGHFQGGESRTTVTQTSATDPRRADKVVVTIEPANDSDPGPSGVVALAGDVTSRGVNLRFPVSFASAQGSAILATPTDNATNANNDEAGVWFLNPSASAPASSLSLPTLPSGWKYEGWAVHRGTPLSSGRFTRVDAADDSSRFSGPGAGPAFPGEDFVRNLPFSGSVNLADGASKIVVSVEPDINGVDPTGGAPFDIKPLAVDVPLGQAVRASFALTNTQQQLPSGRASFGVTYTAAELPRQRGYAAIASQNSAVYAYQWNTRLGWRRTTLTTGTSVFAWPFASGWTWAWTQRTGWLAVQSSDVAFRFRR